MGTKKSTTGGQTRFAQAPTVSAPRSTFNRSCGVKTSFDAGDLVPIFTDEILPGDTMSMTFSHFARLATPIHPLMDNMYLDWWFFFVPNRLLWTNWEKFNGAQDNPGDSTDFTVPFVNQGTGITSGMLADYLGVPIGVGNTDYNALYPRAYSLIWNEFFRDENLQDSVAIDFGDGPDDRLLHVLQKRGKRHDYFTSCLPAPQKGDAVTIGIGGSAPVAFTTQNLDVGSSAVAPNFTSTTSANRNLMNLDTGGNAGFSGVGPSTPENVIFGNTSGLIYDPVDITTGTADLTSATAVTINALRQAFQIQELLERDARGGTRYTELLRSHFGVISPDQRLQRPEILGLGTSLIRLAAVAQTSETDGTPLAELAAYGVSSGTAKGFNQSFTEHGVIIGLISARADLNYQQGLSREFKRSTRFDYYWPAFAKLGEQSVLNREIMFQDDPADLLAFGFQERYAEYRYKPSIVTGLLRTGASGTLDSWHLAQHFSTLPVLDSDFIEEAPPMSRVIAVSTEPHFILDGFFQYNSVRPMPVYGIPGLGSRF